MDGVPPECMFVCVCACDQGHEVVDIPRLGVPGTEMLRWPGHESESGLSGLIAVRSASCWLVGHYSFVHAVAGLSRIHTRTYGNLYWR